MTAGDLSSLTGDCAMIKVCVWWGGMLSYSSSWFSCELSDLAMSHRILAQMNKRIQEKSYPETYKTNGISDKLHDRIEPSTNNRILGC